MSIEKIKIKNFKIFKDETIHFKSDVNIFVGENDSGKSTILEALSIATTGKIDSLNLSRVITTDFFNHSPARSPPLLQALPLPISLKSNDFV
jgi:predicted ATP-dependent endonuclease of OLD family